MSARSDNLILQKPVPSDIEIAQNVKPINIQNLAKLIGLNDDEYDLYGTTKAKIHYDILNRFEDSPDGSYVCISGITPTPLGEGKTTSTLGINQAFGKHLGCKSIACIRQPSMGPTFGIKGGAAGGGYSQVIPMEDFNLHLTGDIHAVTQANNLLAAAIYTRLFHERSQSDNALFNRLVPYRDNKRYYCESMKRRLKKLNIDWEADPELSNPENKKKFVRLNIDEETIMIHRVVDINDRFLRSITIGQSKTENFELNTSFDISVSSEVMAILALATSLADLRERLQKIVCCYDKEGNSITADDFGVAGAMAVLLKEALMPTLMQTLEGTPVFVHTGPFANIAHGNSSILADKMALKLVGEDGFVLTEAGFGSEIGFEKFCNIKCRYSKLQPNIVVLIVTLKALKLHGGAPAVIAGQNLADEYKNENLDLIKKGCENLIKHIKISLQFGIPVIVCVNTHIFDHPSEISHILYISTHNGAFTALTSSHYSDGGLGAIHLANAIKQATLFSKKRSKFMYLYPLEASLFEKIEIISKKMYGAIDVNYSNKAKQQLNLLIKNGYNNLFICMAKTQYSFSHDASLLNVPTQFTLPIQEVILKNGAGFITVLCGSISTMPGLPTRPAFFDIDIDPNTGKIEGLF